MKLTFNIIIIFNLTLFVVKSLLIDKTDNLRIILKIFSGTRDPSWIINSDQIQRLNQLIVNNKFEALPSYRIMGYQGFEIMTINNTSIALIIGAPSVEIFLFSTGQNMLSEKIQNHVLDKILTGYRPKTDSKILESRNLKVEMKDHSISVNCENSPIKGSDNEPNYDPKNDDGGCFIKKQADNNCYNYGTDILTNTFAQPGRGTDHEWQENTCEEIKKAALSDGLQYVGTEYPKNKPIKGHYIAELIWPETNFHWVRLDSNGKWSHKPGGSRITNKDNDGLDITNPSIQDFSPWTEFCGYFLVIPTNSTIG